MRRRSGINWLAPFLLFLVCVALGYRVYSDLGAENDGMREGRKAAAAAKIAPLPPPAADEAIRLGSLTETVRRPLFHKTRRPPETAAAEPAPPPKAPRIKLLGVIITGEWRTALIRLPGKSEIEQFVLGQKIDGWVLESVSPDRVELRLGESRETYRIDETDSR